MTRVAEPDDPHAFRFEAQGYRVKALLRDLATSPAMRRVSEVTP